MISLNRYDNLIKKLFIDDNSYHGYRFVNYRKYLDKNYPNISYYINNRFDWINDNFKEVLYCLKHNINEEPKCPICGAKIFFIKKQYKQLCPKCACSNPDVKQRISEDRKSFWANKENKERLSNKLKENWANRTDKQKETKIKHFQETWYSHDEEWHNNFKRKLSDRTRTHMNSLSKEEHQILIDKMLSTKDKNHTHNTSKPEIECYEYIKTKFPDTLHHKRTDKYNFNCDFYIPSIDVYIEYQGTWTHGEHPFDPNNKDDLDILKMWENKQTEYYNSAIRTWTIRDPLKRKTAQDNNLKWYEVWNKKEFVELVDKLYIENKNG